MAIVTIAGSPAANSRSAQLLSLITQRLRSEGFRTENIAVRELPAAELLAANTKADAIAAALRTVEQARVVIIATPVYKASYSGLLKSFLDLLPQAGLRGKVVLPIATGGSNSHLLALDYALRPVLAALGARVVIESVFAADAQLQIGDHGIPILDAEVQIRLDSALASLQETYGWLSGDNAGLNPIRNFPVFAV